MKVFLGSALDENYVPREWNGNGVPTACSLLVRAETAGEAHCIVRAWHALASARNALSRLTGHDHCCERCTCPEAIKAAKSRFDAAFPKLSEGRIALDHSLVAVGFIGPF